MAPKDDPDQHRQLPKESYADIPPEAFRRSYIPAPRSRETFTDVDNHPDLIPLAHAGPDSPIDSDIVRAQQALRYFEFTLVPGGDFFDGWEELSAGEQGLIRAAVLQEFFNDSYKELEKRLKSSSVVAREAGFDPDDPPSDTTLWRKISDLSDDGVIEDDAIKEVARRADIALLHMSMPGGRALHQVGVSPRKPDFYYEITKHEREIDIDEKMDAITELVSEYMVRAVPHIDFDRDSDAPNYQYCPEAFYRLLAHMALEDCYAEKGSELLDWQTDDDVGVPDASTLYRYADEYSVDEHANRFLNATCELLNRKKVLPDEPVHLGFDITEIPWYGKTKTDEEGSSASDEPRIKSRLRVNTVWFWEVAVLSIVAPERNYVLGFSPIGASDEEDDAQTLDKMLNRVEDRFDLEFGRIYLDSGLASVKFADVCEDHDLNWLMQDNVDGKREQIVKDAPEDTPGYCWKAKYGNEDREMHMFACPKPKERIKATGKESDEDETENRTLEEFGALTDDENVEQDAGDGSVNGTHENVKKGEIRFRHDLTIEEDETWSAWNTNMDVRYRNLPGLAYNYEYRWRVETAIRQLKHSFTGRCGVDSPKRRALYLGAGQLFFNIWVVLNHALLASPLNNAVTYQ